MLHGDLVILTTRGIVVHEKALQPVGIYGQSMCWGVWAANPHEKDPQFKRLNLIISPFHPSSWPFLIRLEVLIFNVPGALARVLKIVAKKDLSILFVQCSPTGFRHATVEIIATSTKKEIDDLKRKKEDFDKKNRSWRISGDEKKGARELANEISISMLRHARDIEHALCKLAEDSSAAYRESRLGNLDGPPLYDFKIKNEEDGFLFDHSLVAARMCAADSTSSVAEYKDYIDSQLPKPVFAHYMQRLAYFSIYGGGREVPFSLHYKANSALLELDKEGLFSEGSLGLRDLPAPAIATFNSVDKYLRLNPVTPGLLSGRLTRIGIEYRVVEHHDHSAEASKWLLHLICEKLQEASIDLLHISNKWTRYEYAEEAGFVSLIGDVSDQTGLDFIKSSILAINTTKPTTLDNIIIKDVSVSLYPNNFLFLSLHSGHPRHDNIREIVHRVAAEAGFNDVIVETYVSPATGKVLDELKRCQAFLQLLTFRQDEDPAAVSFSWLDFEYGVAAGLGIPTLRLVDTVRMSLSWWQGRIATNIDQRPKDFRSDTSDEDLADKLREAVQELAREVAERQQR